MTSLGGLRRDAKNAFLPFPNAIFQLVLNTLCQVLDVPYYYYRDNMNKTYNAETAAAAAALINYSIREIINIRVGVHYNNAI